MNSKKVAKRLDRIEALLTKLLDQSSGKAASPKVAAAPKVTPRKTPRPAVAKKRKRVVAKRAASEIPVEKLDVEQMTDVPVTSAAGAEGESHG